MADLPEKNTTGRPRPPGDDVAAKQVPTTEDGFLDALGRVSQPPQPEKKRRGRGSPRKSGRGRSDG